ncbi:hypothetical protein [Amycolatopsis rubida]|uniref:Uncharacterized protein n=1 Tax=Amycolatopsis rubida TaxID=112413 RepID=A0A1I5IIE5_9PSEU|nr:hypothetical protein [Amycolatopsis rubida]SFO60337.1 hypothetical protein SAMN05421854_102491 [Amycolatopsis rubida]
MPERTDMQGLIETLIDAATERILPIANVPGDPYGEVGKQVARDTVADVLRVLDEEIGNANDNGDDWPDFGDLGLLAAQIAPEAEEGTDA